MELKRVVVTGLGALTPLGNTVEEFWKNLVDGVSGAAPITRFDASKFKTQFACEVKNFDAQDYFDRKEARKLDLYAQFADALPRAGAQAHLTFNTLFLYYSWLRGEIRLEKAHDGVVTVGRHDGRVLDWVARFEAVGSTSRFC